MTNIILCGGAGTRLWPISRNLMPKQFVKLFHDKSLFQLTIKRNSFICNKKYIVSNAEQYFLALDQIQDISSTSFLLEPIGRSTAPAIALACFDLDPNEVVLVTPSDHIIKDEENYAIVLEQAKIEAKNGNLVTFGIPPSYPEIGFGYIEADGKNVLSFKEKPTLKSAEAYLKSKNYYWNSGMFCFKAGVFLSELEKYSNELYKASKYAYDKANKENIIRIRYEDMEKIPDISIDYAVMEKSSKVKVITSDINWSDLGSFDSLYKELQKDVNGNTVNENHIAINSKNNLIISNKTIATIDLDDILIINTEDALLISKKGSSQKVKQVVKKLKAVNSPLSKVHITVHRPWGEYTILENTKGYKIKRITVNPGKRLSLQKHYHRNEHWIVVSGTATIQIGKNIELIRPNESTYIKMGEVHRLSNEGKIPIILIEVQVGEYTEEDDIIRISDDFLRN